MFPPVTWNVVIIFVVVDSVSFFSSTVFHHKWLNCRVLIKTGRKKSQLPLGCCLRIACINLFWCIFTGICVKALWEKEQTTYSLTSPKRPPWISRFVSRLPEGFDTKKKTVKFFVIYKGELLSNGGYDIVSKNYRRDMGPVLCVLSKRRFHLNGNIIGFHPQTRKLELHAKHIAPFESTVKEVSFEC